MKYTCPDCGKTYTLNYCDDCKKIIESPTDKSSRNAMLTWGIITMVVGGLFGFISTIALAAQGSLAWIYTLFIGIGSIGFGFLLLGISAIVDRLNTIIKLMKENKNG